MELDPALVAAAVPQVQVRRAKFGARMAELTLRLMCGVALFAFEGLALGAAFSHVIAGKCGRAS